MGARHLGQQSELTLGGGDIFLRGAFKNSSSFNDTERGPRRKANKSSRD